MQCALVVGLHIVEVALEERLIRLISGLCQSEGLDHRTPVVLVHRVDRIGVVACGRQLLLELFSDLGVIVPSPGAVRQIHASLLEHRLVVEKHPRVLTVRQSVVLTVKVIAGNIDVLVALIGLGDISEIGQTTGLRIRVVLLQVLDREHIRLGSSGDITGHLLVVVVGRIFLDLDGDVRMLLLECLSKVGEFRTRIKRPACQRDFRLGVFIQRLT